MFQHLQEMGEECRRLRAALNSAGRASPADRRALRQIVFQLTEEELIFRQQMLGERVAILAAQAASSSMFWDVGRVKVERSWVYEWARFGPTRARREGFRELSVTNLPSPDNLHNLASPMVGDLISERLQIYLLSRNKDD